MQRIVIFMLGLLVGGGLIASVPFGEAHDDRRADHAGKPSTFGSHDDRGFLARRDRARIRPGDAQERAPVAVFLNLDAVKLALRTAEQEKKPSMQQIPREIVAD